MSDKPQQDEQTIALENRIKLLEQEAAVAEATIQNLLFQINTGNTSPKQAEAERERLLEEIERGQRSINMQKELLAAVFENSPAGIAIIAGSDLTFRIANSMYRSLTPNPQVDPVGLQWKEVWPEGGGFQLAAILRHVLETGETIHSDHHTRRFPDGVFHYYSMNLSPLFWNDETVVLSMLWETTYLVKARNQADKALKDQNQLFLALKQSEERFRTSVENLPDGYAILSAVRQPFRKKVVSKIVDFRFEYVNDTGCRLFNIPKEEITGRSLLEQQLEAKDSSLFDDFVELVETGQPIVQETLRYKNLSTREERLYQVFDTRAVKLGDGLVMTWRDVTNRVVGEKKLRKALLALQESERRLELAHQAAGLGSWNWKFGDSFATCSETFFQLHGLEPAPDGRIDLEQYLSRIHPSDAARVRDLTFKAVQEIDVGPVEDNEFRFLVSKGSVRWMAVYQKAVHEGDTLVGISGVTMDITNRKRAEQKIQRSEQHLRNVLDTIFSFVGVLTPEGILLQVNRSPLEAAGISLEDVSNKRFEDTHWWDYSSDIKKQLRHTIDMAAKGEPSRYDVQIRVKDGQLIYIDFMIAPMYDESGKVEYLIPSAVDITARKNAEADLQRYAERLERSNQELEQFAFIASHDLQEPLRKIEMFSKTLLESSVEKLDDQERDFLKRMDQASGRMRAMITDLLGLSRVTTQGRPFIEVDLKKSAARALSDLDERLKKTGGRVDICDLPTIAADPIQMEQLFQNLISNALKFHKPGIPPTIKISSQYLLPTSVQIMVEDNGIGFDSSQVETAFQPFRRLVGRSKYEGSGIGLAICRKIVERHGGAITAQSNPGEGSVFIFTLPLRAP
jgi:PAS domain S-box-containing protein